MTDHDRYTRTMLDAQADMAAALDAGRESEAVDGVCHDLHHAQLLAGMCIMPHGGESEWDRRRDWAASCWIAAQKLGGGRDTH